MQCFSLEVQVPEVRAFYSFQAMMETIHLEMYALLVDTFAKDSTQKKLLFEAIDEMPHVKAKADWSKAWMNVC